jgi:uncharacterized protein (DUF1778 family)
MPAAATTSFMDTPRQRAKTQPEDVATPNRTAAKRRLECRITAEAQQILEMASEATGRSITDVVLAGALREAREALENVNVIHLTRDAQERFAQALLEPAEPNEALQRAAKRHKELIRRT